MLSSSICILVAPNKSSSSTFIIVAQRLYSSPASSSINSPLDAMVRKQRQLVGGLSSLFSSKKDGAGAAQVLPCPWTSSSSSSSSAWQWPSCGQPRTLSFRQQQEEVHGHHHDQQTTMKQAYKTMNSAYSVDSFSTAEEEEEEAAAAAADSSLLSEEAVIRALRSDRLFFEPDDSDEPCIVKHKLQGGDDTAVAFGGATVMSVESRNPYRDFRASMEAMVLSHGGPKMVKDWLWLEEMLGWYLRANGKTTHGLIVGAFVDLLVSLSNTSPSSSSPATPTPTNGSACSSSSSL